jgi:hypothetical protein
MGPKWNNPLFEGRRKDYYSRPRPLLILVKLRRSRSFGDRVHTPETKRK